MSLSPAAWMPASVNPTRPPSPTACMSVLVKDLCNPDVVARIAKRRYFQITDRPTLTAGIWARFRDLLSSVDCAQPVDPVDLEARLRSEDFTLIRPIDSLIVDNHTDASRKIRDCPPRMSKSPEPEDPWPEGYETPGPDPPEVIAESNKNEAKKAYDTLIQMGGRPTGPIRPIPPWKSSIDLGHFYEYAEEEETLFYSHWHGTKPDSAASSTEAGYIAGHWTNERKRCSEELRRWLDFLHVQQWRREHRPEFAKEEEMERQRYPQDPYLPASLKKLKDWKEYQLFFQRGIDRGTEPIEGPRRKVEAIQRKDPEVRGDDLTWLRLIERRRKFVAAEEKRLEWVKQQLSAVLSECAASLVGAPTSRREMELRSELGVKEVFNSLVETGGRPSRSIRPVPDSQERDHTDEHLHVLHHWQGEWSQFEEELRKWRKFLKHRQKKEADGRTELQLERQQFTDTMAQVDLWKDYRVYQQLEVENAQQWVRFWQRQMEDYQEIEDRYKRLGDKEVAYRYHSEAEATESYVEEMGKQVRPAEMRLEWVEQQLAALLAERAGSMTEVSASESLEDQAKLPKSSSMSGQAKLNDHRSNQSNTLAPRSNYEKKKNRASASSTLGPIHSSRVSKAARSKAPRCRRHSQTCTEHGNGQNQGPNTTISPTLPNIALRRSNRSSNNEKRSGVLEAGPALDLDSPPIMTRRSDRIFKQRQNKHVNSDTAVNLAPISQTDLSRRPSRPKLKGRCAGNKSDASSVIRLRGISKREGSTVPRRRTRIHG